MRQATSQMASDAFRNSASTSTSLSCRKKTIFSGFSQGQRIRVSTKIRVGITYNKVLLLVADFDSVYGIGREGTAGFPLILYKTKVREREKNKTEKCHSIDYGDHNKHNQVNNIDIFSSRLADSAIPQHCGPQRPGERLSCLSPAVRSPCRETLTAVSGASPGPPLSPVSLHKQAKTQNINPLDNTVQ